MALFAVFVKLVPEPDLGEHSHGDEAHAKPVEVPGNAIAADASAATAESVGSAVASSPSRPAITNAPALSVTPAAIRDGTCWVS